MLLRALGYSTQELLDLYYDTETIYLGEDRPGLTPVGEEMSVYIGDSRDIVVTQRKMHDKRINLKKNNKGAVVLYDTDELIEAEIENFKDKLVNVITNDGRNFIGILKSFD